MLIPFLALVGTFFTWLPSTMYSVLGALVVIGCIAVFLKFIAFVWDVIPFL